MEKVYVAVGNDVQEGLATLEWTLRRWSADNISIVILHADINKDYVYTYYGKLPASYVNDESVDYLKKFEQGKVNKVLSQYIAFCGQVQTETMNIVKYDEPLPKRILQLISGIRICKLVMGITFLKSSSMKYNNLFSGLKYIQRNKPYFCELYLTSGGKLFYLKERNNEEIIEDDQGDMVVKLSKKRGSFKGWIGKLFPENAKSNQTSSSLTSTDLVPTWDKCAEEIEAYFNQLQDLYVDEDSEIVQVSSDILESSRSIAPVIPKDLNPIQKTEFLRIKVGEARDAIQMYRREAKESAKRYSKAEWAINLCTSKVSDLEARLNKETIKRRDFEKDLDAVKEEVTENQIRLQQNKSKLNSTLEIQKELASKLKSVTLAKSQSEEQLKKMIHKRSSMVQEIENLREQKDVMQRRIEFCRDKDAIEMVTRLNDLPFSYKEFTANEIRAGTENFSGHCRIKCFGDFTNVYRAQINHTTVVVKLYGFGIKQVSDEEFDNKVKILSRAQHPNLVAMLGFCSELKCIVFEYMHQSCLRNVLFSNGRRQQALNWHARVCIAADVCSALTFLHLSKPRLMVHGNLNLANVLLDCNNVAKLHGFRLDFLHDESDVRSDIRDFGSLVLQLLTERNWCGSLDEMLDQRVGDWPLEVAMKIARIGIRCSCRHGEDDEYMGMMMVMKDIEEVKILSRAQHPNLVAMLGFCSELKCIVFEYMHQSCLRNVLFSNGRRQQALNWHARVCIAADVCSALTFLHLSKPRLMVHGNLNLANVLLDCNNVAKLHGFRLDFLHDESDVRSDIRDFGSLVLQLLTERNWCGSLDEMLDQRVGDWPLEVAMKIARIGIRCSCRHGEDDEYMGMMMVMKDIEEVRKMADDRIADVGCLVNEFSADLEIPSFFFCPILKDVMKDPHIASDGFSYELGAIKQWLEMGNNTSPMTNLDLEHRRLTPNKTLRSLIQDWHKKRSIPLPLT